MHRKRINASTVLPGERLGIKTVDEEIWRVSFMSCFLGFVDPEHTKGNGPWRAPEARHTPRWLVTFATGRVALLRAATIVSKPGES